MNKPYPPTWELEIMQRLLYAGPCCWVYKWQCMQEL